MNDDLFSINLFNDANSDEDEEDYVYRETEGNGNGVTDESNNNPTSISGQEHQIRHPFPIIHNLSEAMEYLSCSIPHIYEYGNTSESKYEYSTYLMHMQSVITTYLGSMAQCRVHGKEMDHLGGIEHLMHILHALITNWEQEHKDINEHGHGHGHGHEHEHKKGENNEQKDNLLQELEFNLVNVTLGALRDLACGNASNRLHIGQYKFYNKRSEAASTMATDTAKDTATSTFYSNGISIISYFIQTYGNQTWEQIAGNGNGNGNGNRLQLRSMTNALGVMRNITHSTPFNCQALHEANMTTHFINRLRGRTCARPCTGNYDNIDDANATNADADADADGRDRATNSSGDNDTSREDVGCSSLPDASKPWREACYRIAGTLINMAEKCQGAAVQCAKDEELIFILIESWGGVRVDLDLHLNVDNENEHEHEGEHENENENEGKGRRSGEGRKSSKKKKAIPVLHLGLKAVLVETLKLEREDEVGTGTNPRQYQHHHHHHHQLLRAARTILEREERRKRAAQEREIHRKKILGKKTSTLT